jgi:hypothetical protein
MRSIFRPQGPIAVDVEDQHLLLSHRWHRNKAYGYAVRNHRDGGRAAPSRTLYLHRVIMQAQPGQFVDHISGDILDNRRCNLRLCTKSQNGMNRRKANFATTSRFHGVHWCRRAERWRAQIKLRTGRRPIGNFGSEEAAARAYDAAAREHFGEFARLNFPQAGKRAA